MWIGRGIQQAHGRKLVGQYLPTEPQIFCYLYSNPKVVQSQQPRGPRKGAREQHRSKSKSLGTPGFMREKESDLGTFRQK